ncbi:hypothetical protein ONZ45_g6500 [Pleurotus djamor]|nr:hypothetical protein ONZ45_g6500 [Pleurotus djamor]
MITPHRQRAKALRYTWLVLRVLCMVNILLVILLAVHVLEKPGDAVYSPAQDVVEYEIKRFNTGFLDEPKSVFQGPPTDAMDAAWQDLYKDGVSYLLPEEARLLRDPTVPAPGAQVYVGGLDVFHQIHCLDMIRMAAYPDRYNASQRHQMHLRRSGSMGHPKISDQEHLQHCINSVRQSLMCSSDISINPYYNPKLEKRPFPRFDQLHTCRNFEKIKDWAFKRTTNVWHEPPTKMNNPFKIDPPSSVEIELEREPFLGSSGKDELDVVDIDGHSNGRRLLLHLAGIVLLSFSSISILHVLLRANVSVTPEKIFPTLLYSEYSNPRVAVYCLNTPAPSQGPVEHLIEYQHIRFHTGFFDDELPSVFDGPSTDAMDKAWLDLYDIWTYAVSSLTEDENDRLPDPTVPAFGNHSQLFGGIDVFHQLHCLVCPIPPSCLVDIAETYSYFICTRIMFAKQLNPTATVVATIMAGSGPSHLLSYQGEQRRICHMYLTQNMLPTAST